MRLNSGFYVPGTFLFFFRIRFILNRILVFIGFIFWFLLAFDLVLDPLLL